MLQHISTRRLVASVVFVGLLLAFVIGQKYNQGAEQNELKVLYAGNPGSPRMDEFVAFLKPHFAVVGTCDLQGDFQKESQTYDVVVLDWTTVYKRDSDGKMVLGGQHPDLIPKFKIDASFSKPVVMIGPAAGHAAVQLRTAIDWRCLCLENFAHDTDTNHPIFKGPLPVDIQWQTMEKPFDYFTYPGSKTLGEELKVWKVQERTFPEVDPGLVSSRERFSETPNAEAISGGINGKGPNSVAIGRHGNFFLWGFSGSPTELTEPARAALVNCIHYMKAFDGQTPGPYEYELSDRDQFLGEVYQLRMLSDEYAKKAVEKLELMVKQSKPSPEVLAQLGDDPALAYKKTIGPIIDQIRTKIPADVREATGDDTEKLIAYYTDNLDYVTKNADAQYIVDDDLKELGFSNRTNELIAKCIELLRSPDKSEQATRILHRYVGDKAQSVDDWNAWYQRSGKKMKLDDRNYRFYLQ
jgi:hypothetical protein